MTTRIITAIALSLALALVIPGVADAQTVPGQTINNVLTDYQTASQSWQSTIASWATGLFWLLATLELLWVGIRLVLRGADIGEFTTEVVQFILFVGFFYAILLNGYAWVTDIVTWFRQAAGAVNAGAGGSASISPAGVLDDAIQIVATLWNDTKWTMPGYDIEIVAVGIVVLLTLGIVTAYLCEALIESYLVIGAGIIFLGFGGSRWTKDYAVRILNYAVSVGAKLFFLQLIIALGMQFINQYTINPPTGSQGFVEVIGVLITLAAMVVLIPSMIQSLVNGSSFSTGSALLGAVGSASAAAAGGVLATGAALGLGGAAALSGMEGMKPGGAKALRGAALPFEIAGRGMGHMAESAASDLGRRLSGRPGSNHGTMFGRMAGDMASRISRESPPEPPPPPPSGPSSTISPG